MNLDELKKKIKTINRKFKHDPEDCHGRIDDALLEFINDDEVTELYNKVTKWCA